MSEIKQSSLRFKIGDTVYVLIQDIIYKGIVAVVTQLTQTTVTGTHNKIDYAVDLDNDGVYIAKDNGDIFKTKEEAEKQEIKNWKKGY